MDCFATGPAREVGLLMFFESAALEWNHNRLIWRLPRFQPHCIAGS